VNSNVVIFSKDVCGNSRNQQRKKIPKVKKMEDKKNLRYYIPIPSSMTPKLVRDLVRSRSFGKKVSNRIALLSSKNFQMTTRLHVHGKEREKTSN
jgi:hypothetical protein